METPPVLLGKYLMIWYVCLYASQQRGETTAEPINYRKYAGDAAMLHVDEPDEVFDSLDDLVEALACTARSVEEDDNEQPGLKNAFICMHDVFKIYAEHNLEVPQQLVKMREKLEQRRNALDPHSPRP